MVGEINSIAKQLDLKEPLPIVVPADTNRWEVKPPPMGVGGSFGTSNYWFGFEKGRLTQIRLERASKPITNLLAWTREPCLTDTNGAYRLATQWLAALSYDVSKLDQKYLLAVRQRTLRITVTNESNEEKTRQIPVPNFQIGWVEDTNRPSLIGSPVHVTIDGATKELLSLGIQDVSLFTNQPLRVTNAADLLGPLPFPRHFVEQLVDGRVAYETVAAPDQAEAWLLEGDTERVGPKKLNTVTSKAFSDILLDFDSYAWTEMKLCDPNYGLRLRFFRGNDTMHDVVEFRLCYECDILEVTHNGQTRQENFDFAHNKLVKAIQQVFPRDKVVKNLELDQNEASKKEFERMLKSYEN